MADIADVLDAIVGFATSAVFPNGTSSASVTGGVIDIAEGWPEAADIDAAMKAQRALVTVYDPGVTSFAAQVFDDPGVIVAPVHGLTATATASGLVTLTGTPGVGEYVTFVVDKKIAYSVASVAGDTSATMAAKIAAALVAGAYPGTTASGSTVQVTGFGSLTVRIGAPATLGRKVWRQKQDVIVTVWAPDPATRNAVSKPIDVALKSQLTFNLPDTSRALMTNRGSRSMIDNRENVAQYRRDIIMTVQYDTIQQIPAWEVTSVNIDITPTQLGLSSATTQTTV